MPLFIVPAGTSEPVIGRLIGGPVNLALDASCTIDDSSGMWTATVMPGNGLLTPLVGKLNARPAPAAVAVSFPASERHPCPFANIVIVIGGVATIVCVIV